LVVSISKILFALALVSLSYWAGSNHRQLMERLSNLTFEDRSVRSWASGEKSAAIKLQLLDVTVDKGCQVKLRLFNSTNRLIDGVLVEITVETERGRESLTFYFRNVAPELEAFETARIERACLPDKPVQFEKVLLCNIGGQFYEDCAEIVTLEASSGTAPNLIKR